MHLAAALAAGRLAARAADRRFRAPELETEIREAHERVIARRVAPVAAPSRRDYPERGRHAAPRPA
ncbi:hypothetical protein [Agromyces italicus]|uniref:hypothetical protein n=1 Tax=Agromyces italicus TaxID=279572 RepID=UPI0003B4F4B0|nr:hypothetical protein [Agromyces italicus]